MPLIVVVYLVGFVISYLISFGVLLEDEDFTQDFKDFLHKSFFPSMGLAIIPAIFWPIITVAAIPCGPAWLIWKSLHGKAVLKKAVKT